MRGGGVTKLWGVVKSSFIHTKKEEEGACGRNSLNHVELREGAKQVFKQF